MGGANRCKQEVKREEGAQNFVRVPPVYAPPDFHTEIDVEIFNDASRRVLFTTYANGEQTNTVEKRLPFDATADFHEYRIDLYPTKAEFSADGRLMHTFDEGLPGDSMQLMVNTWYPDWLPGEQSELRAPPSGEVVPPGEVLDAFTPALEGDAAGSGDLAHDGYGHVDCLGEVRENLFGGGHE